MGVRHDLLICIAMGLWKRERIGKGCMDDPHAAMGDDIVDTTGLATCSQSLCTTVLSTGLIFT